MRPCHENAPERRRFELGASSGGGFPLSHDQLGLEHDVFLSFSGQDTRKGFTSHLYRSLLDAEVKVFRDEENLHVGDEISGQLIEGIKQSKISIPVFSKNYAYSKWCLKEFALAMECRRAMNQIVMPIFFDVTPNEVQHQTGEFREAFAQHMNKYGEDTVQQWRDALSEVGSLKGWVLQNMFNGDEAELVKHVVAQVLEKLGEASIMNPEWLKGLEKTWLSVKALVDDAEDKAMEGDDRVKLWLYDFRDLSYDFNNLRDDFTMAERIGSFSATPGATTTSQNISTPQAAIQDVNRMKKKMKDIKKRMSDILVEGNQLGLRNGGGESSIGTRPASTSLPDPHICGRESDK